MQYNEENIEIGERLRGIREGMKMSRENFSERIDITDSFLGQIERGERALSVKTLKKVVAKPVKRGAKYKYKAMEITMIGRYEHIVFDIINKKTYEQFLIFFDIPGFFDLRNHFLTQSVFIEPWRY